MTTTTDARGSETEASRVFVVEATVSLAIQAVDEDQAIELAKASLQAMQSTSVTDLEVFALRRLKDVPDSLRDTIPGNARSTETVSEYLDQHHVEFCDEPFCSSCNKLLERRY